VRCFLPDCEAFQGLAFAILLDWSLGCPFGLFFSTRLYLIFEFKIDSFPLVGAFCAFCLWRCLSYWAMAFCESPAGYSWNVWARFFDFN